MEAVADFDAVVVNADVGQAAAQLVGLLEEVAP
jgi:hypothetical protein